MSFPFEGRYYLCNKTITKLFAETQNIDIIIKNESSLSLKNGFHSPGGAFIVNKEKYLEVGGENENFHGFEYEDHERIKRIEVLGLPVHRSNGPLFHLWHPGGKNKFYSDQSQQKKCLIELLKTCINLKLKKT